MRQKVKLDLKLKMMIFSLVAFIATLITAGYAWVTSDLLNSSTALYVGSVSLSVLYRGTSNVIISDLAPGESVTKTFEIVNSGTSTQVYNLKWIDVTNNLIDKNYFMYKIKNVVTGEEIIYPKYLPSNSTHIKYGIEIASGETHSYELTIYYIDDPKYNQLQNADLYFSGDISIEQGSNEQRLEDRLSIFVNGVHSDYLPTLSQYSIDTTRTFCTEGSSISIVNGDLEISNLTEITSCELYLVSSTPTAITNDPYNLLIIDTDGGTLASTPEIKYRYSGDIVSLGVPEKSGYAFMGWQVSGSGTQIIDNIKVLMGSTYSYVKAIWARGHWNKIIQTCNESGVATYNKTYKTCDASVNNYTKKEKTCGVSNWNKTTSVCGITGVTKKVYTCAATAWAYPTNASSTLTDQTSCTPATPACNSNSDVGNNKITCTATKWRKSTKTCEGTYVYTDPTTSTTLTENCTVSSNIPSTCTSSNANTTYTTSCTVGKNTCRKAANAVPNKKACYCLNVGTVGGGESYIGCYNNQSSCAVACENKGGSYSRFAATTTCTSSGGATYSCPDGGNLISGYCYLNRGTYPCVSPWTIYKTEYYPTTKTCQAGYAYTDVTTSEVTSNCSQSSNIPSTCTSSNVNTTYITKNCEEIRWTKKTYTCAVSAWSYPSSATSTSVVTPSQCSASTDACAQSSNVGNLKVTCGDPKTYSWTSSTTSHNAVCSVSGTCSESTVGNSYVTACSPDAYNFGEESSTTENTCTPNPVTCSSGTSGQTNITCDTNYSYALSSGTQTVESETCATSNFTCDSTTAGQEYITNCSPKTMGYGYIPSNSTSNYCFVDENHNACNSNNVGGTYTYACEFVEE